MEDDGNDNDDDMVEGDSDDDDNGGDSDDGDDDDDDDDNDTTVPRRVKFVPCLQFGIKRSSSFHFFMKLFCVQIFGYQNRHGDVVINASSRR